MRCFYDGGISRGIPAAEIPWSNTHKDYIRKEEQIATGLWSRLGKVIHAPDYWLNRLPNVPLDAELYIGPKQFQKLVSITKASVSYRNWDDVKLMVFDSPPYERIFADGEIEVRLGSEVYRRQFKNIMNWVHDKGKGKVHSVIPGKSFENVYAWLKSTIEENETLQIHLQEMLPFQKAKAETRLDELLEAALAEGNEGLVLRSLTSSWTPARVHSMLKVKKYEDDEAICVGYVWGETGIKDTWVGAMGAMIVEWKGKRFKLSGFTAAERGMSESAEGISRPGTVVSDHIYNPTFPRGTVITFKYRELSRDGIPKEASYLRKRVD
jgi:DNA ligase-1